MKCLFAFLILISGYDLMGQNKVIAILGSSTAAGTGPSSPDSSWVRRLSHYYKVRGVVDTIYNHAVGGYNSYHGMPSDYIPPPGRPSPDLQNNVTTAVNRRADIVIISYVSNNYDVYTIDEIKKTLFTLFDSVRKAKKIAFVTTTQPRTSFTDEGRWRLRILKDSIIKWFGNYSINFWNPIADSSNNTILPEYNSGDNIHLNNAGHRILFEQVVAKNIFNFTLFPLKLESFNATSNRNKVKLEWCINTDQEAEVLVQRSNDGVNFESIKNVHAARGKKNYRLDDEPGSTSGLNYYRLQIINNGMVEYSRVVTVEIKKGKYPIATLYPVPARNVLNVKYTGTPKAKAMFQITDAQGKSISSFSSILEKEESILSLNISQLTPGNYYFRMEYPGSDPIVCPFQKL